MAGIFGLFTLCDVLHRANHPDGLAAIAVQHRTAVIDKSVRTVVPAETILVGPEAAAFIDDMVNTVQHPPCIVGMNSRSPAPQIRADIFEGIAENGLQSTATVHPPAGGNSERTEAQ